MNVSCIVHGKKDSRLLKSHLQKSEGIEWKIYSTSDQASATELTRQAITQGTDRILAVGGDGTWNEVVNGILTSDDPATPAILYPLGTGNDWSRTWPAPGDSEELNARLLSKPVKKIDVGHILYTSPVGQSASRYFVNIADAGMGAQVVRKVNDRSKWLGADLTFVRAIIETFITYNNAEVCLEADEFSHTGLIRSVIVANGKYFGSGMCIAPEAAPDDGRFAIVIIGDVSVVDYLKYLPAIRRGELIQHPGVSYHSASHVKIQSPGKLELEADGEFLGFVPAEINVMPQALCVL